MSLVDLIGYGAGILTAASQLPQALKAWRSRSTADLSVRTLLALALGLALWLAYGLARSDLPVIAANGVSLAVTAAVLTAKLRFG